MHESATFIILNRGGAVRCSQRHLVQHENGRRALTLCDHKKDRKRRELLVLILTGRVGSGASANSITD
jgi:hypothetical protein